VTRAASPAHSPRPSCAVVPFPYSYLYYKIVGGYVLNPLTARLWCAYPTDGDSMAKTCETLFGGDDCIPGCYPPGHSCIDVGHEYECSYPPENLRECMSAQMVRQARDQIHNEMVIDIRSITSALPGAIEAMFYLVTSSVEEIERIRMAHNMFLQARARTPTPLHAPLPRVN
jgi:hypothetical protein